jgi:MYXO-CTERM domain-containing protein
MFIDEPAISNRMMQWMDFDYQVSAELYYDTTYAMSTASQDSWTTQYEFGNNGDGSIFYPGKPSVIGGTHDIPIESFRMKMLREGMQDYEYLNMLTTLGDGAFAQTELAKVVTSAGSFTSDPSVLEQARLDMATEIEKDLAKADGGATGGGTCDGGTTGDGGGGGSDAGLGADGGGVSTNPVDGGGGSADGGTASGSKGGCHCTSAGASSGSSSGAGAMVMAAMLAGLRGRRRRVRS